jgi:hypothetical protein
MSWLGLEEVRRHQILLLGLDRDVKVDEVEQPGRVEVAQDLTRTVGIPSIGQQLVGREADPQRHLGAVDLLADRLRDLDEEAGAVLQAAAVLVGAAVETRRQEALDDRAVGDMDLDAVVAGGAQVTRIARVVADEVSNLVVAHLAPG